MWSRSPTFGDAHLHLEVVALTKGNFVLLELGQSPMISAAIFELHLYLLDPASLISNSANTGFVLASISPVVAMTAIANVEARCCSFSIESCSKSAPQESLLLADITRGSTALATRADNSAFKLLATAPLALSHNLVL
jgi:hypothetical protein